MVLIDCLLKHCFELCPDQTKDTPTNPGWEKCLLRKKDKQFAVVSKSPVVCIVAPCCGKEWAHHKGQCPF